MVLTYFAYRILHRKSNGFECNQQSEHAITLRHI